VIIFVGRSLARTFFRGWMPGKSNCDCARQPALRLPDGGDRSPDAELIKQEVGAQNVAITLVSWVCTFGVSINFIYLWNASGRRRAASAIETWRRNTNRTLKERLRKIFAEKMPGHFFF